jgi:hypothetical protein
MTGRFLLACAAIFSAITLAVCGGDDDEPVAEPTDSTEATFDEGTVRMEIELLDTGLLKGHSYATSIGDWTIDGIDVVAVDEKGVDWQVIEIPEKQDDQEAVEFFEVTIQELPRGDQITVTTKVFFLTAAGLQAERTVLDRWPP